MATSKAILDNAIREKYIAIVKTALEAAGEEVLITGSNEIALPCVDTEGNEKFLVLTFKVPTGADKGMTVYDGYAMAEEYELKLKTKADKARESAERKAKKVARDAEIRKRKAEISAKREG